jgi:hypothetical protein
MFVYCVFLLKIEKYCVGLLSPIIPIQSLSVFKMPTILRIAPNDQYDLNDMKLFTLTTYNVHGGHRFRIKNKDLYRDIPKNSKTTLQMLAKECDIGGYTKMRKQELIDNLMDLIIFEQPVAPNDKLYDGM